MVVDELVYKTFCGDLLWMLVNAVPARYVDKILMECWWLFHRLICFATLIQAIAAEGSSDAPTTIGGLNPTEAGVLIVPVALYAAFTIYRKSNPRADVGNFLLGIMAVGIFSNILFIGLFKIRLF